MVSNSPVSCTDKRWWRIPASYPFIQCRPRKLGRVLPAAHHLGGRRANCPSFHAPALYNARADVHGVDHGKTTSEPQPAQRPWQNGAVYIIFNKRTPPQGRWTASSCRKRSLKDGVPRSAGKPQYTGVRNDSQYQLVVMKLEIPITMTVIAEKVLRPSPQTNQELGRDKVIDDHHHITVATKAGSG